MELNKEPLEWLDEDVKEFLQDISSEFRGNPVGVHRVVKAALLLKQLDTAVDEIIKEFDSAKLI